MLALLIDPDGFFRDRRDDPGLLAPVLVVVLAGIATTASTLLVMPHLTQTLSGPSQTIAKVALLLSSFGGGIGIVTLWFIYAGSFHTISIVFDGEGAFRTVFLLTGWGFLPVIVSGAFGAVAVAYTMHGTTVPGDPQELSTFVDGLRHRPALLTSSLVRLVLLVWQGFIWTFAVKHARALELREAALTVACPVIATVGWNVYQLL